MWPSRSPRALAAVCLHVISLMLSSLGVARRGDFSMTDLEG
jgi:hypothetical protein